MVRFNYPPLVFLFVLIMIIVPYGNASDTDERSKKRPECTRLPPRPVNIHSSEKIDLFHLLNQNPQHQHAIVNNGRNHKDGIIDDAILILGNTGSGKTTITQILAGNLSRIHAVKTGRGNLVIVDDDERIGLPSTNSKTIRPELVIRHDDNSTSTTAFYDCPGFNDRRSSEMDIAVNFLMNQMVKSVKGVKLLFVIKSSTVEFGKFGNHRDFDSLANHATTFVKDLKRFKDSFALIVTMVNRFVMDSEVMRGILQFLHIYKRTKVMQLQALRNNSSADRQHLENKIFFVETLLQRSRDASYPKISFSRSPNICGPLKKSAMVQKTRKEITTMYTEALRYTPVDDHDFGYSLKDKTILDVQNLYAENLNQQITEVVQNILTDLTMWSDRTYFSAKSPNLAKLLRQLDQDSVAVRKFVKVESGFENLNDFTDCFISTLRTIGYKPASELIHSLQQNHLYLDFFQESVSRPKHGQSQLAKPRMWLQPVSRFQKKLEHQRDFYEFLSNLETQLDEHSVHKNRKVEDINLKLKDPLDWLTYIKDESIIPIGSHVTSISEKMSSQHLHRLDTLMKMFLSPTEIVCKNNTVTVKGNCVAMSEFVTEKGIVFTNDSACNANTLKLIQIYASKKIFIDRDIQGQGRELSMVLIAPKWSIIGNRTFHLEGSDAPEFQPPQAKNGTNGFGENGEDGKLGIHGNPGGSVFGIAVRFDGTGNLKIIASGGRGGRGQNGGDGGNGSKGRDAHDVEDSDWDWHVENVVNIVWTAWRSGFEGYRGGNGGYGGNGGIGGRPGYVDLITPDGKTEGKEKIETVTKTGPRGETGVGGRSGHGGLEGLSIYCRKINYFFFISVHDKICTKDRSGLREGMAGNQGLIGSSHENEKAKLPAQRIDKRQSARDFVAFFGNVDNQATQDFVSFIKTRY